MEHLVLTIFAGSLSKAVGRSIPVFFMRILSPALRVEA